MRNRVICIFATLALLTGCERAERESPAPMPTGQVNVAAPVAGGPAESREQAPLLLLEDEPPASGSVTTSAAPGVPHADNSRCFVCHVNYTEEELAATHARANIGCGNCHGVSDAHIADESWASGGNGTAPDTMFPRDKIDPACRVCHPRDKIDTPEHVAALTGAAGGKVCTDCHGNHRLPQRRCTWR